MKKLPELTESFSALIASPSISALEPEQDQSNAAVIDLLANWFADLGLECRRQPVPGSRNKHNLLASLGTGQGACCWPGIQTQCRSMKAVGSMIPFG